LTWTPYRDGILMARVPAGLHSDQFFVNGKRQILARYPKQISVTHNEDISLWDRQGHDGQSFPQRQVISRPVAAGAEIEHPFEELFY